MNSNFKYNLAASFQDTVIQILSKKLKLQWKNLLMKQENKIVIL